MAAVIKRHVFPIVRYDEYATKYTDDLQRLISIVKVLEDESAAEIEAQRLNGLNARKGVRYWASLSRIAVSPGADASADDFVDRAADLAAAIRLGYEVERNDPNIGFETPPDDEIDWLAAWLVSEGWSQTP